MDPLQQDRIFISYKRVDKDRVFALKDKIEKATGEKCWIDLDGIESDAQFSNIIVKAINRCEVFVFMYSKAHAQIKSFEDDWTIKEITFAKEKKKRIVIVHIDNTPLIDQFLFEFPRKQRIDASDEEALKRMCSDICMWLHIKPASPSSVQSTYKNKAEELFLEHQTKKAYDRLEKLSTAPQNESNEASIEAQRENAAKAEEERQQREQKAEESKKIVERKQREVAQQQSQPISTQTPQKSIHTRPSTVGASTRGKKTNMGISDNVLEGVVLVLLLSVLIVGLFWGASMVKKGDAYLKSQDYKKAVLSYTIGQHFNSNARYKLAYCYEHGLGVEQNKEKAFAKYLYVTEADGHLAECDTKVGLCYYYGSGVDKNYNKAVQYFQKAAGQGEVEAQYYLANCYYAGTGVKQDRTEAFKWYKVAAEKAHTASQAMLGKCYQYGYGVEKDINQALQYYRQAAEKGNSEAQSELGQHYAMKGDYATAIGWFAKAAEQGHSWSQNRLGHIYYNGKEGVRKNYAEALKWFMRAAEQGNMYAMFGLGKCYYYGHGVAKSKTDAQKWFKMAADKGHSASKKMLDEM